MCQILSNFGVEEIKDCLQENILNNEIKVTYGDTHIVDGEEVHRETNLTDPHGRGLKERLDYIFELDLGPKEREPQSWHELILGPTEATEESALRVQTEETFVVPSFTKESLELPFSQLSDHYGVSTSVVLASF